VKSKAKANLLVVAHPDDETLFFAGLLLREKKKRWHVVCVTDGNADGQGAERHRQFAKACKTLGVASYDFFNLPDLYQKRLDLKTLKEKLFALPEFEAIYTHGPTGEYGHPHHQDVSFAVHECFAKNKPVWSVAHNCEPDRSIHLNSHEYKIKSGILSKIYLSETERFIGFVPSTSSENFCRISFTEVREIYNYLISDRTALPRSLKKYKWFKPYFKSFRERLRKRPF
jgi:LmbE family N-acetylglucosaminyl deacetylase